MKISLSNISLKLHRRTVVKTEILLEKYMPYVILSVLTLLSGFFYLYFLSNHLGLSYNDARSHLDIGRRVVEGLKPGLAQLGSVWLPLPHLLMILTIWNDFMWHSGLSGALQSMIAFVLTGFLVYLFLKRLNVGMFGRLTGVGVFAANLNILYMQSTAMTELLLIATMTAGIYELLVWQQDNNILNLMKAAFWIMLATLNRYDGWFLFLYAAFLVCVITWRKFNRKAAEGMLIFFVTLAGLGIALWFLWNLLIFKDPLYFVLGPYSAHAQQQQLQEAGVLATKGNLPLSLEVYLFALAFNQYTVSVIIAFIGAVCIFFDKRYSGNTRLVISSLLTPFVFNVLALFLGFSVLFVQNVFGGTWFNVRYGILMAPSLAIFIGYSTERFKNMRFIIVGIIFFVSLFAFMSQDAVTLDDARVGSSQKNVSEVANWLHHNALNKSGYVLISAASHDAIIFSSGLPMDRFIHEGTGAYWVSATTSPDRWSRWIIMRTNDSGDLTFRLVSKTDAYKQQKYTLVGHYPFADIYELKPQYVSQLHTTAVFGKQK